VLLGLRQLQVIGRDDTGEGRHGDSYGVTPRASSRKGFGKGIELGSVHQALLHDAML